MFACENLGWRLALPSPIGGPELPIFTSLPVCHVLVDVDFNSVANHRTPSLQKSLQPRIAGKPLAIDLDLLWRLVVDGLDIARGIVRILKKPSAFAAKQLIKRLGGLHHRQQLLG